jgi:hypothetical protein
MMRLTLLFALLFTEGDEEGLNYDIGPLMASFG